MNQLFKDKIPNCMLFNFLDTICVKSSNYYLINNSSYKKAVLNNSIAEFVDSCKPYYHISKHKYLEKKHTYNSFTTILRQICKNNKISFTSKIKYDKSSYEIIYFIYFDFHKEC